MFSSDKLAIEVNSDNIKILFGSSNSIKQFGLIKTPADSVVDNKILKVDLISDAVGEFLKAKKIKAKKVSFAISGQDIVVRHIDVPIMDNKNLMKSVQWEINRNLPDNGENYYLDYEVLSTFANNGRKLNKVLAVSAPIEKIDSYVELSEKLKLEINSIDLAANSIARVFSNVGIDRKNDRSVGIIDLGSKVTEIIIIENGKLFVERELPFGRENFIREISRRLQIENNEAEEYLTNKFNFENIEEDNEVDNRIKTLLDNVLASFQKVIQFYTTGKTQKLLNQVYIAGCGCQIKGINNYVGSFLNSPAEIADSPKKAKRRVKLPSDCEFQNYLSTYGILLRKEN